VTGDDQTTLADARLSYSQPIGSSTTTKFSDTFSCRDRVEAVVKDNYSFTVTNVARLTGASTNLTASASVTVNCEQPQQASIAITAVKVASATKGAADSASGTFTIQNQSGGGVTIVTLGHRLAVLHGEGRRHGVEGAHRDLQR
jgi:hypothetical protein